MQIYFLPILLAKKAWHTSKQVLTVGILATVFTVVNNWDTEEATAPPPRIVRLCLVTPLITPDLWTVIERRTAEEEKRMIGRKHGVQRDTTFDI